MAFDENGQADTFDRKVEICQRAFHILTDKVMMREEDIIFDPNIFAVATGIEEHNQYGKAYIDAAKKIRELMPKVHVSGGVSNLSFSFRVTILCARQCIHVFISCHHQWYGYGYC